MKLSELWLREWINIEIDSEQLFEQIIMAGFDVNRIEPVAGSFNGVLVGEIIECTQHPNDNKLCVTKVNIGNKRLLNIICNAPNCRRGLKSAVATVNSTFLGNFKIKVLKLCDELSEGALCSFYDLGISKDCEEIIELPYDAPVGVDVRKYMRLDDNSVEISVTPNRADCLSIIGIARDLAAFNRTKFNTPKIKPTPVTINETLPIRVDVPEICPRYLGRIVKNINIKASTPLWMKEKLRRCGMQSVDPVINIINYVLLEFGQPIHAFDKDQIEGGVTVRMAKESESIVLLDGNKIKLSTDTVIIADKNRVLEIGGVFVCEHSSINKKTKNILLECAFFNPKAITAYIRRYGLHTESSQRYERGVDPTLQYRAIERATYLLIDICGGEAGPVLDVTSEINLPKRDTITLRRSKLDRLIGYHITNMQVSYILRSLGCNVIESQDEWLIIVPSWRFDIKIEEDLIEEIVRIYGYNNLPDKSIKLCLDTNIHRESTLSLRRAKTMLNDKGYQEVITYSFVDPKLQQLIYPSKEALILSSPISREMSVMRLSLWIGLLKTIIYNQNRQQNRVRIFEAGLCFIPDEQSDLGVRQDLMLAGAISGSCYEEHWNLKKNNVDFYDMKGDLESIFDLTGRLSEFEFREKEVPALHPGQSAAIYLCNECIGFIGVVHPELERKLALNGPIVIFELAWNKMPNQIVPKVQAISRFPAVRRDISIIVIDSIPAADILAECKKVNSNYLVNINLFDVYRGKGISKNYKSLAISLIFQDSNRSLEEEEIAVAVSKYVEILKNRFQASLRDL